MTVSTQSWVASRRAQKRAERLEDRSASKRAGKWKTGHLRAKTMLLIFLISFSQSRMYRERRGCVENGESVRESAERVRLWRHCNHIDQKKRQVLNPRTTSHIPTMVTRRPRPRSLFATVPSSSEEDLARRTAICMYLYNDRVSHVAKAM